LGDASALHRRPDWPARLAAYVEEARSKPFDWKTHNCATFVVGAAELLCGVALETPQIVDIDAGIAARQTQDLGGLEAAASLVFGPPIDGWKHGRRGDVALALCEGRPTLFLVAGATLCGPGLDGLVQLPLTAALKVWKVG